MISILVLFLIIPAFFPNMHAATQQAATPGDPIQGDIPEEEPSLTGNYIKVGYVYAIFRDLGEGDIYAEAYEKSITLSDDDHDGLLKTTVGVEGRICLYEARPRHLWILWGNLESIWKTCRWKFRNILE